MPKKKIIIERKFRKTRKKITVGIILFSIGNGLLLLVVGWFIFFHKPNIVSPVPMLAKQSNHMLADPHTATTQTKSWLHIYNIPFDSLTEEDSIIKIQLSADSEVWLAANKNIEQQIASLQLALNQFTIEGKKFKKLDFRFDRPVVTF